MDLRIVHLQEDYAVVYCDGVLVLEGDPQHWTLELVLKQLSPQSRIYNYEMGMDQYKELNYALPPKFIEVEDKLSEEHEFTEDDMKKFSKTQNLVKTLVDKKWVEI